MSVINPVKLSMPETLVSIDDRLVDERTARTIQQQYQVNHQEEFLRLKAQVEALLSEIQTLAVNDSSPDSELAL
jgi:hypothetical protein